MIICTDHHFRDSDGSWSFDPDQEGAVWEITAKAARKMLPRYEVLVLVIGLPGSTKNTWLMDHSTDNRLYVDATFSKAERREPFIQIAKDLGKPVIAVWVDTPLDQCLAQNAERDPDRRIPEDQYDGWWADLLSSPPSLGEGFDAAWRITAHDDEEVQFHEMPEYDGAEARSGEAARQGDPLLRP